MLIIFEDYLIKLILKTKIILFLSILKQEYNYLFKGKPVAK